MSNLLFLSTLSLRRATLAGPSGPAFLFNFYPRSPCGERRVTVLGIQHRVGISIHALLAESDLKPPIKTHRQENFYPRSPCGERRPAAGKRAGCYHFYPRSPCGERHLLNIPAGKSLPISIHALLAESDCPGTGKWPWPSRFLSTLSLRRATLSPRRMKRQRIAISIHALLAESDSLKFGTDRNSFLFLSTLSLRRATPSTSLISHHLAISIHALLAESDCWSSPRATMRT